MSEEMVTEKWMAFEKNGWHIRREYETDCLVSRVYATHPSNGRELFLGYYGNDKEHNKHSNRIFCAN